MLLLVIIFIGLNIFYYVDGNRYPKGLIVAFKLKSTSVENDNQVKSGDAKPYSME